MVYKFKDMFQNPEIENAGNNKFMEETRKRQEVFQKGEGGCNHPKKSRVGSCPTSNPLLKFALGNIYPLVGAAQCKLSPYTGLLGAA